MTKTNCQEDRHFLNLSDSASQKELDSTTVWLKVKGKVWVFLRLMRAQASLKNTVLLVVCFKILVHAAGVRHLFPISLWHEQRVIHSLLLVEEDVCRICVSLLWIHFLQKEIHNEATVIYNRWSYIWRFLWERSPCSCCRCNSTISHWGFWHTWHNGLLRVSLSDTANRRIIIIQDGKGFRLWKGCFLKLSTHIQRHSLSLCLIIIRKI